MSGEYTQSSGSYENSAPLQAAPIEALLLAKPDAVARTIAEEGANPIPAHEQLLDDVDLCMEVANRYLDRFHKPGRYMKNAHALVGGMRWGNALALRLTGADFLDLHPSFDGPHTTSEDKADTIIGDALNFGLGSPVVTQSVEEMVKAFGAEKEDERLARHGMLLVLYMANKAEMDKLAEAPAGVGLGESDDFMLSATDRAALQGLERQFQAQDHEIVFPPQEWFPPKSQ